MKSVFILILAITSLNTLAQEIKFTSAIAKDFEGSYFAYKVVGKVGENYCVLKPYANGDNILAVYDANMKLLSNERLKFIPTNASVLNVINYQDHFAIIYTYRTEKVVYLKGIRLDSYGRKMHDPITLDEVKSALPITLEEFPQSSDTIRYFITVSENKQFILCSKHIEDYETLKLSTRLLSPSLELIKRNDFALPLDSDIEMSTLPIVDNNGTFLITKSSMTADHVVSRLEFISKSKDDENFKITTLPLAGFSIAELRLDVDNINNRYLLNALFLKQKSKDVEGLFTASMNINQPHEVRTKFNAFSDILRAKLSREPSMRQAFNDLTLQKITFKKDRSFIISVEETSSKSVLPTNTDEFTTVDSNGHKNRVANPPIEAFTEINLNLKVFDPPVNRLAPQPRMKNFKVTNSTNSIIIMEVDSAFSLTWNSVITKVQVGDEKYTSFGKYESGSEVHFLFTGYQANDIVNHYSILGNGEFIKNTTLKTQASGRILMPKHLIQVAPDKVLVPASYRRRIVFALIDFSKPFKIIY